MKKIGLLFLIVFLSGCVTSQKHVNNVQRRVVELERQVKAKDVQIAHLQYSGQSLADLVSSEIIFDDDLIKQIEAEDAKYKKRTKVSKSKSKSCKSYVKRTKRNIQKALKKAGYYRGRVDGVLGKRSRKAIKSFQQAKGLRIDGLCGKRTWRKLKVYL